MSTLARRQLLGSALAVPTLGSLASPLALAERFSRASPAALLLTYNPDQPAVSEFVASLQAAGLDCQALAEDPVRQWRQQLQERLQTEGQLLLGIGYWADYVLQRDMAAELRRHPLLSLQHAPGQYQASDWGHRHARELLGLLNARPSSHYQTLQSLPGQHVGQAPSLFTWVLG